MASSVTVKYWVLAVALIYFSVPGCKLGAADDEGQPQTGPHPEGGDPAQIVAKALLCFNDKFIYSSCEESYRLTQRGNLNVPPDDTDQYCNGPCLTETNLVLDCIDGILSNFVFYNKATIQDIRDTIRAACSYSSQRGDFNVAEHIKAGESSARKAPIPVLFGLLSMIIWRSLFL